RRDVGELRLQVGDLVAHAAGRVDHERDVERLARGARTVVEARVRGGVLFLGEGHEARRAVVDQALAEREEALEVAVVVPRAGGERAGSEIAAAGPAARAAAARRVEFLARGAAREGAPPV